MPDSFHPQPQFATQPPASVSPSAPRDKTAIPLPLTTTIFDRRKLLQARKRMDSQIGVETSAGPPTLRSFYTPRIPVQVALHRRGDVWYLVLARAYGMANGNMYWEQISSPDDSERGGSATHDPPDTKPTLNPRFWFRDAKDWGDNVPHQNIEVEDLLAVEPELLKDSGLRRTRTTDVWEGKEIVGKRETEERLVEVMLKEEELSHRCMSCGGWELGYASSPAFQNIGLGKDGRPIFWCGVSTVIS